MSSGGADAGGFFEVIYHDIVQLPANVEPWAPTWAPDGRHILFNNIVDGTLWLADQDGGNAFSLTGDMDDVPKIAGAFSYVFPDEKRVFLSNELGDNAYVLECEPTVYDCTSHEIFPIDLAADAADRPHPVLGRRTFHLAPDGEHLGYTVIRLDHSLMTVAELVRTATGYATANHKVVNPAGPTGPTDTSVQGWANAGALYELKGFAEGGASVLVVGEPDSNFEVLKIDLAGGGVFRLTGHPDWDEDGAISPDGQLLVVASWRTMRRIEALGLMPHKPFFGFLRGIGVANYYVSSFPGFQCDIQPWLLPGDGDSGGTLVGQPLAPFKGGDIITGNNLASLAFWSPDSTRVLVQERMTQAPAADANASIQQKGHSPNRLLIARIDRDPTAPAQVVRSVVGDWAPAPAEYNVHRTSATPLIQGEAEGTIALTYEGNILDGAEWSAVYSNYSEDGITFLSGTEAVSGSSRGTIDLTIDLTLTDAAGKQIGAQSGSVQFRRIDPAPPPLRPPWTKAGNITSTYKGKTAAPLADVGPRLDTLPRASDLMVETSMSGQTLTVNVTADVYGDTRPVRRAVVVVNGRSERTDSDGNAVFTEVPSPPFEVEATAGDTFMPARVAVGSEGSR
jgi:hypothetical protein